LVPVVLRPVPALAGAARLAVWGWALGCGVGWRLIGLGGTGTRIIMGWVLGEVHHGLGVEPVSS